MSGLDPARGFMCDFWERHPVNFVVFENQEFYCQKRTKVAHESVFIILGFSNRTPLYVTDIYHERLLQNTQGYQIFDRR